MKPIAKNRKSRPLRESFEQILLSTHCISEENGLENVNSECGHNRRYSMCSYIPGSLGKSDEQPTESHRANLVRELDGQGTLLCTIDSKHNSGKAVSSLISRVKSNIIPSPITPAKIRNRRSLQRAEVTGRLEISGEETDISSCDFALNSSQLLDNIELNKICNDVEALVLFHEHKEETVVADETVEALVLFHELKAENLTPTKPIANIRRIANSELRPTNTRNIHLETLEHKKINVRLSCA